MELQQQQFPDTTMSDDSRTMSPASFTPSYVLPIRTTSQPPSHSLTQNTSSQSQSNGVQTHLLKFYKTTHFTTKTWACHNCSKRASGLYHISISKLYPFTSRIYDMVVPVCHSPSCDEQGRERADEFVRNGGMGGMEGEGKCESCEERSRMRLCATCRFGLTLRGGDVAATSRPARSRQRGNRIPASARLEGATTNVIQ